MIFDLESFIVRPFSGPTGEPGRQMESGCMPSFISSRGRHRRRCDVVVSIHAGQPLDGVGVGRNAQRLGAYRPAEFAGGGLFEHLQRLDGFDSYRGYLIACAGTFHVHVGAQQFLGLLAVHGDVVAQRRVGGGVSGHVLIVSAVF